MIKDVALRSFVATAPAFARSLAPPLERPPQRTHVWVSLASALKDRCNKLKQTAAAMLKERLLDRVIQHY